MCIYVYIYIYIICISTHVYMYAYMYIHIYMLHFLRPSFTVPLELHPLGVSRYMTLCRVLIAIEAYEGVSVLAGLHLLEQEAYTIQVFTWNFQRSSSCNGPNYIGIRSKRVVAMPLGASASGHGPLRKSSLHGRHFCFRKAHAPTFPLLLSHKACEKDSPQLRNTYTHGELKQVF